MQTRLCRFRDGELWQVHKIKSTNGNYCNFNKKKLRLSRETLSFVQRLLFVVFPFSAPVCGNEHNYPSFKTMGEIMRRFSVCLKSRGKIEIEMFVAAIFTSQFDFYLTTRNRLANEDDKSFVG